MASWGTIATAEPKFAHAVQSVFDSHKHKVLATLRRDGSPRLSGIEATFAAGELWLGMMPNSFKAHDLLRDPRMALHSATVDVELLQGDAKLSGRAIEATGPHAWDVLNLEAEIPEESHLFRIDVSEVSLTRIGEPRDHLVIESWSEARGLRSVKRY
ncbi:MAG: pyridoxamine 5'-phosphate oxidase family protein [Dehalococcoidia bacterium]|nr:pyridoxamine 5'-phosphate oxidase family protein [Dehalococcoidia bacterium]HRC61850.1 pyridoxamine 5'-phosphate oxidase family protein [Dehalococcoidia bacterium]